MVRVCIVGLALLIVSTPAQAATGGVMTITGSMSLTVIDAAAAVKDTAFTLGVKNTIVAVAGDNAAATVSVTLTAGRRLGSVERRLAGTKVTAAYTITIAGGDAKATALQASTFKSVKTATKAALQTQIEVSLKAASSTLQATVDTWAAPTSKVAASKVAAVPAATASDATHWLPSMVTTVLAVLAFNM